MNNKNINLCPGHGCDVKTDTFYQCDLCDKNFCFSCMHLSCSDCKKFLTCYWCTSKFKRIHNLSLSVSEKDNLKCSKCSK